VIVLRLQTRLLPLNVAWGAAADPVWVESLQRLFRTHSHSALDHPTVQQHYENLLVIGQMEQAKLVTVGVNREDTPLVDWILPSHLACFRDRHSRQQLDPEEQVVPAAAY
jgi:hypothetical protein